MIRIIKRIINNLKYDRYTTHERLMCASNSFTVSK